MNNKRLYQYVSVFLILLVSGSSVFAQSTLPAEQFQISQSESSVIISVYRSGALSVFGHNHVISSHALSGAISLVNKPERTGHFSLSLPFSSLVVDNDSEREKMGKAFRTTVDESAKLGTRKHMMSAKVLDYPRFKKIEVSGNLARHVVTARISLHGISQDIQVPVKVNYSGHKLVVRGHFSIKQSLFGIMPYKAAAGLLKIKDTIKIDFSIAARK